MISASGLARYKNKGLTSDELRRRRENEGVQLRKQKRAEQLSKKRNLGPSDDLEHEPVTGTVEASTNINGQCTASEELYTNIGSTEPVVRLEATMAFRKLLSQERNPPINDIINAGIVPKLVEFLNYNEEPMLQFEAAWALTNIASGNNVQTRTVLEAGAVPRFVDLISSHDDNIIEQAIWALGNIAGDGPIFRDYVLSCNVLPPLLKVLASSSLKLSIYRNGVWALSNMCRGKNPYPDFSLVSTSLPVLARLLFSSDAEILTDACWAIGYLTDGPNDRIQTVIDSGICRRLIQILMHPQASVVQAALRVVGNIVTGDDTQTQVIINCTALPCLHHLLHNPKEQIKKEACWTLSNITAGNKTQIQAVCDANIIPTLVGVLTKAEFRTRKEAAWAISNATSGGSTEQLRYFVECGTIPPLCDLLTTADIKLVLIVISALDNILKHGNVKLDKMTDQSINPVAIIIEECGGLEKLEFLQQHQSTEIYNKSYEIIQKYFSTDENDMEDIRLPVQDSSEYAFQFDPTVEQGVDFTFT